MPDGIGVGFDLDMTLIDTRPGFQATLRALGQEAGVEFDVEAMTAGLGPPLSVVLEPYFPAGQVELLVDRFRELYPHHAVAATPALPGAQAALAAVRRHGGRTLVVTGKYPRNALPAHRGPRLRHRRARRRGLGRGEGRRRWPSFGADVYVGDHVHDVEGALAAGVISVSVLTGGCCARGARRRGDRPRAGRPWRSSRTGSRTTCSICGWHALRRTAPRARLGAGRLLRRRRQRVPARGRGARPRAGERRRRHRPLRRAGAGRARPGTGARRVARRALVHPGDPRARAPRLPGQRPGPLLPLQGRADRDPAPAGPRPRVRPRSRPAPTPTTSWPASGPASARLRSAVRWLRWPTSG